ITLLAIRSRKMLRPGSAAGEHSNLLLEMASGARRSTRWHAVEFNVARWAPQRICRRVPGKLFRILVQEIAHSWCLVTSSIKVMDQGTGTSIRHGILG